MQSNGLIVGGGCRISHFGAKWQLETYGPNPSRTPPAPPSGAKGDAALNADH